MAVKYQIPFESNAGVKYRVDIYDPTYSGTPIELQGGDTPFTTEEENSDDFFTPIRASRGTLSIINGYDIDGFLPVDVVKDVLPKTNTERFMELKRINGVQEVIEWQGYLSCEAFTQAFTDQEQEIEIECNSVLQAMDSKRIELDGTYGLSGLMTIRQIIYNMLHDSGIYDIAWSAADEGIFDMMLDTTVCYEVEEVVSGYNIRHHITGLSVLEILTRIATYMGWCLREKGDRLYITRVGENANLKVATLYNFLHKSTFTTIAQQEIVISTLDWMGDSHNITFMQGAKSVSVTAKVDGYDLQLGLPECPRDNLSEDYTQRLLHYEEEEEVTKSIYEDWQNIQNLSLNYADNVTFRAYRAHLSPWQLIPGYASTYGTVVDRMTAIDPNDLSDDAIFSIGKNASVMSMPLDIREYYDIYCGAFIGLHRVQEITKGKYYDYDEALYLMLLPYCVGWGTHYVRTINVNPIFSVDSVKSFRTKEGYMKLSMSIEGVTNMLLNTYLNKSKGDKTLDCLTFGLRIGNQYWNGSTWSTAQSNTFSVKIDDGNLEKNWAASMGIEETDGHLIPVPDGMFGTVEIMIYPYAGFSLEDDDATKLRLAEIACDDLSVEFIPKIDSRLSDRSENKYISIIHENFQDEKDISTEIATSYYNNLGPTLVMKSESEPMTALTINGDYIKPERDLLNRLYNYYKAVKQKVEITVSPLTHHLPIVRITGYDGEQYIPVAESRDYAEDTSELTLLEV